MSALQPQTRPFSNSQLSSRSGARAEIQQPLCLVLRTKWACCPFPVSKASSSIIEVVFAPWSLRVRALQELRRVVTRLARGRALGRIGAELGLQVHQVCEDVDLSPQFFAEHRRPSRKS